MGTTPIFGFPYPDPSDLVANYPATAQQLAEDVEDAIYNRKILQVVRAIDSTERSTTSTTFVDVTGMSVTITPQKSDSAILVISTFYTLTAWTTGDTGYGYFGITDSSNNVVSGGGFNAFGSANLSGSGGRAVFSNLTLIGYSTPATLSATTYKLRFRSESANVTTIVRNNDQRGQMIALEISA
jgi:hypothetical protein